MSDLTKYHHISENIRFTDEISFKLLGLVPLVSGATFGLALFKNEAFWSPAVFYISLFGSLITLALFRWELRNLKNCEYLKTCLPKLNGAGSSVENKAPGLLLNKLPFGKTEAEKFIYAISTLAWMGLPCAVFQVTHDTGHTQTSATEFNAPLYWQWGTYFVGTILLLSIFSKTKINTTSK
jgi:hypothetical protein